MLLSLTGCPNHNNSTTPKPTPAVKVVSPTITSTPNYWDGVYTLSGEDLLPERKNQIELYVNYAAGGYLSIKLYDVWVQAGNSIGEYRITLPNGYSKKIGHSPRVGDVYNGIKCKYTGNPSSAGYGDGEFNLKILKLPSGNTPGQMQFTFEFK